MKILRSYALRKKELFNASITLAREVLNEAKVSNSLEHELMALIQLSYSLMFTNEMDLIKKHLSEFESLWEGLSDEEKEKLREHEGYLYHLKGTIDLFLGEISNGINMLEKSLDIQKSVDNSLELYSTLNNLGFIHLEIGEYAIALDYAQQQISYAKKFDHQVALIYGYENLGILEELKGNYDNALDFYTRCLNIANDLNLRLTLANAFNHIGYVYYLQGNYDLASKNMLKALLTYEDLGIDVFASYTIVNLIRIFLKLGKSKQADNHMNKLIKLDIKNQNKVIRINKKLAQALILKNYPRSKDKVSSQKLFEEIIQESESLYISSIAILNLSELLLDELKTYGSSDVLTEIEDLTRQLYELAQAHKLYPLIIEVLVLRAKLVFLNLELDEARKILNQAMMIAEERGLPNLISLIEQENQKIENEIKLAAEITKKASSLQDRIDKTQIIEYIEKMQAIIKINKER